MLLKIIIYNIFQENYFNFKKIVYNKKLKKIFLRLNFIYFHF